ncbi:MAG: 30S ribosomal protein S6 [Bdellovibrionota bacterium]
MGTSRTYETIIIFKATISDDERASEINKIKDLLTSNGCSDVELEDWGKREIVYGIESKPSGHYLCFNYTATDFTVNEKLTEAVNIIESVVKFQTHKLNNKTRKFKGRKPSEDSSGDYEVAY